MEDTRIEKLGNYILDIAAGPFGSNLKVECFVPTGFPIIDGANLKGFKVTDNVSKFVTEAKARSLHRSIAKRNDVVVTISGNVGQISYIPEESAYEEYLVSQRQFRVTFDTSRVYVPYLVYYFHTLEGQHKILSFANQTGVPALAQPLKNFKNIDIVLPSLVEQQQIAEVLKSLDNKIEVNRRINDNLEQQAQALFKSWFVDFEPFRDQPFVESELGMIPEGWRVVSFKDFIEVSTEKAPVDCYPEYSVTNKGIIPRNTKFNKKLSKSSSKNKVLKKNDLVFGMSREILNWGIMEDEVGGVSSAYNVYKIDKGIVSPTYLRLYMKARISDFNSLIGTAAREGQSLDKGQLLQKQIYIPTIAALQDFLDLFLPITETQLNYREESRRLSELRDTLLPRLMSGELSVDGLKGQFAVSPGQHPGAKAISPGQHPGA